MPTLPHHHDIDLSEVPSLALGRVAADVSDLLVKAKRRQRQTGGFNSPDAAVVPVIGRFLAIVERELWRRDTAARDGGR